MVTPDRNLLTVGYSSPSMLLVSVYLLALGKRESVFLLSKF
jgi:hypothetical protein